MSFDDPTFRKFVNDARDKARTLMARESARGDVVDVLKDFLAVSDQIDVFLASDRAQGADSRILKKKNETLRAEMKEVETKFDSFKKGIIATLANELKQITQEARNIIGRHNGDEDARSAETIRSAAQNIVESIKSKLVAPPGSGNNTGS